MRSKEEIKALMKKHGSAEVLSAFVATYTFGLLSMGDASCQEG